MKIKSSSNKKRYIIVAATIVALISVGAFTYSQFSGNDEKEQTEKKVNYDSPKQEQVQAGNDKKSEIVKQDSTPSQPTAALNLSVTASQQNGETVQIRTLIDNVVASGTCQIELTQRSKKVSKSVPLQALPSSSTCQGFDIPTSELGAGLWEFSITATSDSASGNVNGTVVVTL